MRGKASVRDDRACRKQITSPSTTVRRPPHGGEAVVAPSPVVGVSPVRAKVEQLGQRDALARIGIRLRPPRGLEPDAQVPQLGVGHDRVEPLDHAVILAERVRGQIIG